MRPVVVVTYAVTAIMLLTSCASEAVGISANPASYECVATEIHRGGGQIGHIPWTAAGEHIEAGLFYYTDDDAGASFTMPPGGRTPEGVNTKVLWVVEGDTDESLSVKGKQLDGEASFSAQFPEADRPAGHFPSIIELPEPGCWQLTVTTADVEGTVTLLSAKGSE